MADEQPDTATIATLVARRPEFSPAIKWLTSNGCNPAAVVGAVIRKLLENGRHLPRDQREAYAGKVLLGEFFARWAKKHQGTTVAALQGDSKANQSEVRPFCLALMAVGTKTAFKKTLPKLARVKAVNKHGGELGNPDDYSCFVVSYGTVLAHRFLSNFNPTVTNAPSKAVKYIELTSVSHYLHAGVHVERDTSGLSQHLRRSTRLNERTKLAAKLVYLPALLTSDERAVLRNRYQITGSLVKRMRVKDVAKRLGFPSPNTLSRKLYRVRGWVESQQAHATKGRRGDKEED
jgi:hypothetical protein